MTLYCQFLLVTLFMFQKVTANTKVANIRGERQCQVPTSFWSQHFSESINTQSYFTCVSVYRHVIYCRVDSLTLNLQPTELYLMPEQNLSHTDFFFCKPHHRIPVLSKTRQQFTNTLGDYFKQQNAQKCDKSGTEQTMKVKVKSLSHVRLFATPWTVAHQSPPSMAFSRQEYWSGLPFPSPGDLPDPGIEPKSPALQADALTSEPPGKQNRP